MRSRSSEPWLAGSSTASCMATASSVAPPITKWNVIWFGGHVTHWKKSGKCNLERREGSRYYKLLTAAELMEADADLIVMSGCNTSPKEWDVFRNHKSKILIGYDGTLDVDDAIIFAAAFMSKLVRWTKSGLVSEDNVYAAYEAACRASRDRGWVFHTRGET